LNGLTFRKDKGKKKTGQSDSPKKTQWPSLTNQEFFILATRQWFGSKKYWTRCQKDWDWAQTKIEIQKSPKRWNV